MRPGLVDRGLFVLQDVSRHGLIAEYTGNRVSGRNLERMNASFEYHGIEHDVQAAVPSEDSVVDARGCGNAARFVNHSCAANAQLVELDVRGRTIVVIVALRHIPAGTEILIDYSYCSGRYGSLSQLPCLCHAANCRGFI